MNSEKICSTGTTYGLLSIDTTLIAKAVGHGLTAPRVKTPPRSGINNFLSLRFYRTFYNSGICVFYVVKDFELNLF